MTKEKRRDTPRNPIAWQWENLQNDRLIPLRQAAQAVGLSPWTLRRMAKLGQIRVVRVAHRLKVRQSEVLRLVRTYERKDYANAESLPSLRERVPATAEPENQKR